MRYLKYGIVAIAAAGVVTGCSSSPKVPAKEAACNLSQNAKPLSTPGTYGSTFDGSITLAAGTEKFTSEPLTYAQLMSNGPATFRLLWSGPINTTGTFNTGGSQPAVGQKHTFLTKAGKFTAVITAVPVNTGGGNTPAVIDAARCEYGGTTDVDFALNGTGSGKWKGVKGTGSVSSKFWFELPRK
jgi:hypothetical protein